VPGGIDPPAPSSILVGVRRKLALLVAIVLLAAGCGSAEDRPSSKGADSTAEKPSPSPTPSSATVSPSETSRPGPVIKTAGSDYGPMLFDRSGQAIYMFAKETSSRPECYAACAADWPPVLTRGLPRASGDVRPELLGSTPRRDGSLQVTYAGHPLYFYAHEEPNQVLCHNVFEYGGLWLVVTPDGSPAP